jgi:hypothetical protein
MAIVEFDRTRTVDRSNRKESAKRQRPTKAVQLPHYPRIRIFLYRSCRFVNLCAPPNGLVMIVPVR